MSFAPHLIPLAGFAGLMATAAAEDLRRLIIPNAVPAGLCLLWPFHVMADPSVTLPAAAAAVGCAAAVLIAGALLFARGLIGGGDVKLLTAAALWAGPAATPQLIILTGLLGGLLCLVLLTPLGGQIAAIGPDGKARGVVPYGVAVAGAALIVTIPANFGG